MARPNANRRSDPPVVDKVEFSDPPPRPTQYDWTAIAEQLRGAPNQWALIFERDRTSIVNAIRQGNVADIQPADGFEVRTANNVRHPRTCSLYLRYVPPKRRRK